MCVNINGISSKLEDESIIEMFHEYDIVCLCELKCNYPFSVPGFKTLRSRIIPGEEKRGGVAVLFKHLVWNDVYNISVEKDQVWFHLRSTPGFAFGAVYITPRDSLFYTQESFTIIFDQCFSGDNVLVLGDLNSRMGNLGVFESDANGTYFSENPDKKINANGKDLINMCISCNLVPLNHLGQGDIHFDGGLTYRQKLTWISQLDWALCSVSALKFVNEFRIINNHAMPTNHAALKVILGSVPSPVTELASRSKLLGTDQTDLSSSICSVPVPIYQIDQLKFKSLLPSTENLWRRELDVANLCGIITDILCSTAMSSKIKYVTNENTNMARNAHERWTKVMTSNDHKALWNAINWKGTFDTPADLLDLPSDKEFCEHYEQLLNTTGGTKEYVPNISLF